MKENFEAFLPHLLRNEGGFVNHPQDPGGATNKGITLATFRNYCRLKNRKPPSVADLKKISMDDVKEIYRWQYWDKIWGNELPDGIDVAVFDFAVNSGPSQAIVTLQRVVKCKPDKDMGANTLAAVEKAMAFDEDGTINAYMDRRLTFLKALKTWPTFGKGWSRRVADVRRRALALAANDSDALEPSENEPRGTPKASPTEASIPALRAGKAAIATGAGVAGTVGTQIVENARLVGDYADYLPWLGIAAGILAALGVGWIVWDLIKKRREGSLT